MDRLEPPGFRDYLLLVLFAAILFGYSGISGRPLTMHEARLPQTAREMKATGNWLLPHSGTRPWLERPPLPHWFVIGSMTLFQHDGQEWVVRLPSAIMGVLTVLLTAWMAGKWFGRAIGMLSGFVLATSYEFFQYSSLAEDDIYLGLLVAICIALFARAEFFSPRVIDDPRTHFFKNRPREIWAFFILAGLTNLTKGPLLGIIIVGSTVGTYLLWIAVTEQRWPRLWRYVWAWGWLIMLLVGAAWPLWAYHRYPDVLTNWKYDYFGRMNGSYSDINQPWYYYLPTLAAAIAPWTPACLAGIVFTAKLAFPRRLESPKQGFDVIVPGYVPEPPATPVITSPDPMRFVWCWALAPLIVLSIPKGKHHHYLVPFLAPWAIFGALGLLRIAKWLHVPPRRGVLINGLLFGLLLVGYCVGETFLAAPTDHTVDDTAFLRRAKTEVPANATLFINAKLGNVGNLDFFRIQFYSRPDARLLHNLSYLRDENIKDNQVYVITRARDEPRLRQLGMPEVIDQSVRSHEIPGPEGRFTLFRLTFDPNLKRYPAPANITTMQAMERDQSGPWCGPAL